MTLLQQSSSKGLLRPIVVAVVTKDSVRDWL